jgi:hypothetical protein
MAVRSESSNPMCRAQTHLLILDEDAIANGAHCNRPVKPVVESCTKNHDHREDAKDKEKDRQAREAIGKNKSKGGAGGHGGRGGSGSGSDSDDEARAAEDGDKDGGVDKVMVCHIPPGNPGNAHTIRVGAPAVRAHLAHGDNLGECGPGTVGPSGCEKSFIGNRTTLLSYANAIGQEVTIPGGTLGDEGWFAITTVRIGWNSAGPDYGDGLRNYLEAGPGLGTADAKGALETLLDRVPDLIPLRATGLARLEGRSVCAVVLDGDVKMSYEPRVGDVRGPNLGKVAFEVLSVQAQSTDPNALPSVRVRILDAEAVCGDPLTAYLDAPEPISATDPPDIIRPSCAVQQNMISEPWNAFDSTLWSGDGDQVVKGGLFYAREGASSAAADWISPCPLTVDSATAIRFSNRLNLISPAQNEFAESGALFLINAGPDGTYDKFVFVNVGYTMSPSKVFVELFGSDGGDDFDQYEETNMPFTPSQIFSVDLWILRDAYHVAIANEMIDTVPLAAPITAVSLFETGVQQNGAGLRGLLDMTTISKLCRTENTEMALKRHSLHRGQKAKRLGTRCMTRNHYVRLAKERIKTCAKPSRGMQILAKMRVRPDFE